MSSNPSKRSTLRTIMWLALTGVCGAVLSLAGVYLYLDPQIPAAESYRHVQLETPLRIYTGDGALVAEYGERRLIPVEFDEVPPLFVRALLDTEDKRFYEHSGIDYISLANDTLDLLLNREIRSGASTITMQLARNLSFSLEQTFIRKFKEMLLALKIEQELTKDEILALYINAVPFGKRAYGAQAAALTYYGKTLDQLTLAQLAMLAGIPQAPTAGNPVNGPERALRRRNLVLARMLAQDSITQADYDTAVAAPITAEVYDRPLDVPALYAAEWVRQELVNQLPDLYTRGYTVYTTLDAELQAAATRAVRRGILDYDRRHGYRGPEDQLPETTDWAEALAQRSVIADLEPGIVTAVDTDGAQVLRRNGTTVQVPADSFAWAKPYIDPDRVGAAPQSPQEVVAVGDLIRIRPITTAAEPAGEAPVDPAAAAAEPPAGGWAFAQLPRIQSALVSLDPETGATLALEGGFDFGESQFNHALQAARQPGSGFKPFVYSAALEAGITPADLFMDAPLVFEDTNLETQYRPSNDNNRYNGPTRLREALYRSINLVSMRVLNAVGAGKVLDHVKRFGFDTSSFPRNTQLAVGGGTMAITPMQMAQAYAVFANGGYAVEPHIIDRVEDLTGAVVYEPVYPEVCRDMDCDTAPTATAPAEAAGSAPPAIEPLLDIAGDPAPLQPAATPPPPAPRVLDARNSFIMNSMLQDVIRRGTGTKARALERTDIAGKTGTTDDAADTWFNGYSADLVTIVWVGFPNHAPLGAREYGSTTPLPIWIDYMRTALNRRPEQFREQPDGIITMRIDPETGEPSAPGDPDAIFEMFLAEHAPEPPKDDGLRVTGPRGEEIKPVDIF